MLDLNVLIPLIWLGVIAAAVFIEAATPSLVSIWFALGGLAALIAALFSADISVQLGLFVFISLAALALARPLAKRWLDPHIIPTNADRLLGTQCRVTGRIDNACSAGTVYADGKIWTARSETGEAIEEGALVEILRMEGVAVIVRSCEAGAVPQ